MGRPNAAYLQIMTASTRALAMGLHTYVEDGLSGEVSQVDLFHRREERYSQESRYLLSVSREPAHAGRPLQPGGYPRRSNLMSK
ncbi:hypothetical protein IL306_007838 [Fusarium sp. DS 682]|nr:hypothetical protein IL306_007838 [Fusarium sp. DS 682]